MKFLLIKEYAFSGGMLRDTLRESSSGLDSTRLNPSKSEVRWDATGDMTALRGGQWVQHNPFASSWPGFPSWDSKLVQERD